MGIFSNFRKSKETEYTEKLFQKLWSSRLEKLDEEVASLCVETGIQETSSSETKIKAIVAEYGNPTKNVPARRPIGLGLSSDVAIKVLRKRFLKLSREMIKKAVGQREKVNKQAEKLAKASAKLIKKRIEASLPPPLQPETVSKKWMRGLSKPNLPLVAEGTFKKEIAGVVVKK